MATEERGVQYKCWNCDGRWVAPRKTRENDIIWCPRCGGCSKITFSP